MNIEKVNKIGQDFLLHEDRLTRQLAYDFSRAETEAKIASLHNGLGVAIISRSKLHGVNCDGLLDLISELKEAI